MEPELANSKIDACCQAPALVVRDRLEEINFTDLSNRSIGGARIRSLSDTRIAEERSVDEDFYS